MPRPPDIAFDNLGGPPVQPLGNVPFIRPVPAQAVAFLPGASLSCSQFAAANSQRFTLSMWVYIPSAQFPKGRQQTIFSFGRAEWKAPVDEYVLKFLDNEFTATGELNAPIVTRDPNLVPPGTEWAWYNGGYWHFETVHEVTTQESRLLVESAGSASAVYAAFSDTKGNPILFNEVQDTLGGFTDFSDGRRPILFKPDNWNWIAFAIDLGQNIPSLGGAFLPYAYNAVSIPSLPADAASNIPVAYSQVQMWTDKSISFTNPEFADWFIIQTGNTYRARGSVPVLDIAAFNPSLAPIPGDFAPPAQGRFGRSAILFDGDVQTFTINRGTAAPDPPSPGVFIPNGDIVDFPAGP